MQALKRIVCLFCLLSSEVTYLPGDLIRTVSINFEREVVQPNKKELIAGQLYYISPLRTVVKIEVPVKQWVIYEKNEMIIYYPAENSGFRMIFQYPVFLSFFQAFIGILKEDFGLSEMGYTLKNYERQKNGLISRWSPPPKASQILGEVTMTYQDNKLLRFEMKDPKGKTSSTSVYAGHVAFGSYFFPLEITTTFYSDSAPMTELVRFNNSRFNEPLPAEVIDFKIPHNAKVREVRW